jgi:hypothetical protein
VQKILPSIKIIILTVVIPADILPAPTSQEIFEGIDFTHLKFLGHLYIHTRAIQKVTSGGLLT